MKIFNLKMLIVLAVALIGGLLLFFFFRRSPSPSNKVESLNFQGLVPGTSTRSDVVGSLGEPSSASSTERGEILQYPSENPNFSHEIDIAENKVVFVKEIIKNPDPKTVSTITEIYGQASSVLYGPRSGVGFYLYAYPEKGIAYVGNARLGELLEIWYFVPVGYDEFKSIYATQYSEKRQLVQ